MPLDDTTRTVSVVLSPKMYELIKQMIAKNGSAYGVTGENAIRLFITTLLISDYNAKKPFFDLPEIP